jgi:NAD(P)-dependent dehydrogenase (short-subunit alcohol dehydrogenase family)
MKELKGKIAVVTGAASGIGRAIAHALAEAGTNIVVSDINFCAAVKVRDEAIALGVRAIAVATDVSQHDSVLALADEAYGEFGAVDILCNNAGVSWRPFRTILEASMEDWKFIIDVNLWGVVHGLNVFLPRMREQPGEKHIVNTSSLGGLLPLAGHVPYSATKAAVVFISEAAAEELAPYGFGFTILCPSFVHTNVAQNSDALRPESQRSSNRVFTPYENPLLKKLALDAIDSPAVGKMVANAILKGQLYLNTFAVPSEIATQRVEKMFGPQTIGAA